MTPFRRPALAAALALAACVPPRIPGTEIEDTSENRAVYEVIREYGAAMQRKDAAAVLALVSADYFDDAGTPDPSDDLEQRVGAVDTHCHLFLMERDDYAFSYVCDADGRLVRQPRCCLQKPSVRSQDSSAAGRS